MNNDYLFVVSIFGFIISLYLLIAELPIIFWLTGVFLLILFGPLFFYSLVFEFKKKHELEVK